MKLSRLVAATAGLLLLVLLGACGQTGALFLPEEPPPEVEMEQTDEE